LISDSESWFGESLEDFRSPTHTRHSLVQMARRGFYQMAAGYEDFNDADFLRVDPALRLALGKDHDLGASQSMLSRLGNDVLGKEAGLAALDGALQRSMDALVKKRDKHQIIIEVDSTEDPAHGGQDGHFGKNCFHCSVSPATATALGLCSGPATFTPPM
jgi:hypothetical protein